MLTGSWFICTMSCLTACNVGWAHGEGSCQCRFRSKPIREHLKQHTHRNRKRERDEEKVSSEIGIMTPVYENQCAKWLSITLPKVFFVSEACVEHLCEYYITSALEAGLMISCFDKVRRRSTAADLLSCCSWSSDSGHCYCSGLLLHLFGFAVTHELPGSRLLPSPSVCISSQS